ncbi:Sodium:neurotransmitter symporter family protein [Bacillus sp. THAF10]|uniref:sodium-dependent transporter n=1 Tax=Bacillus sp. THAF10 TaxID=2587848 RepID=UPI001269170C|nr:sodium-dependent transporter [Bacillus sp. THAF10]QFT88576.1 Sodium:neurotransmitter symporter family protein [Bacillus sp. THAF10]
MKQHEQWTSKLGFILAAAGSAIGIGAIWKFPYMAGTNGGGIFFLLFILFTLIIGAPMLLAEFIIGRSTQKDAVTAYKKLAKNSKWYYIGVLGVIASFILLSFYSVVGGWILTYLWKSVSGGLSQFSLEEYTGLFEQTIANPSQALIAQIIFLGITIWVVQAGVQSGIEKASKILMPLLFVIFIVLLARSLTLEGASEGILYFLKPDPSLITPNTFLMALGQALFSLSVGISIMVTYSSYLEKGEDLVKSAGSVVSLNIIISLLSGLVIFPAVFALGLQPDEGPGLVFVVLPAVFDQLPFGAMFLTMFLILLLFATLTSAFSILEIIVAVIVKDNQEKRRKIAFITGLIIFVLGIPSALSFGVLSHITVRDLLLFDAADFLVSNIGLPLGALLISIFVGYRVPKSILEDEFFQGSPVKKGLFQTWYFLMRYVIPGGILLVFLQSLGVFDK